MNELLVNSARAAEMLGMSRSFLYSQLSAGRIGPEPLSFGRKRLFRAADLQRWVAAGCPNREKWLELKGGKI